MTTLSISRAKATLRKNERRIWTRSDLFRLISDNLAHWEADKPTEDAVELPSNSPTVVLNALLRETPLTTLTLKFPYRSVTRYLYGEVPTLEIIQSVDPQGYFSHYTAMQLHGLTEQIPKSVYFNVEQPATGGGGSLSQQSIDRAFKGRPRVTNNIVQFRDLTIHKINGQNTGRLGVIRHEASDAATIQVTDLERTLIDIVVRPVYSGGIAEVANAYKVAAPNVSVNRLVTYLKSLNYTYPYHQAIGFYMSRAGVYSTAQLAKLRSIPIDFDFYLTYQLKNPVLNEEWRLYTPKGF
jgi:hypothetical protein